jgi:hypothetical protein
LWNLTPEELAGYRQRGQAILRRSFNPVSDETMRVFVDGLLPESRLEGRSTTA